MKEVSQSKTNTLGFHRYVDLKKQNRWTFLGGGGERETNHKRPLELENKLRLDGGRGWARQVMGTKEGTCYHEHWVLYVSDESLNSTPETQIALYVNYKNLDKNWKRKKQN